LQGADHFPMTLIEDVQHEPPIEELLQALKDRIDHVVAEVATHAYEMGKREEHLSSRLAQAIYTAISLIQSMWAALRSRFT
jgi:hypothetical protein